MIARFVVGLLLASHSAVDAKVHRPYTLGGPDAACFKYDTNTPILPCTPLNSGEIVVEWATAFPPAIHALKPFTASWKITATAAFIAEHGNRIVHTNMHACSGIGRPGFGYENCNPFGVEGIGYIKTRNPELQGDLVAGQPTIFTQVFRGGLGHLEDASLKTVVLAHVVVGNLEVALPAMPTILPATMAPEVSEAPSWYTEVSGRQVITWWRRRTSSS